MGREERGESEAYPYVTLPIFIIVSWLSHVAWHSHTRSSVGRQALLTSSEEFKEGLTW